MSLLNIALGGAVVYLLMKRSNGAGAPIAVLPEGVVSPPPVGVPGLSQPAPGGAGPVATPLTSAPAWTGATITLPGGTQTSIALGPANVSCPPGTWFSKGGLTGGSQCIPNDVMIAF